MELSWRDSVSVADECATLLHGRALGRLLDAGGGTGTLTRHLLRRYEVDDAVVLDLSPQVPPTDDVLVRQGRIEDLSAADGQFGTILLRQVLHYVHSPVAVLRRLRDRLSDDGTIYVGQMVVPDPTAARWLATSAQWITPTRRRVWTVDRLMVTLGKAGLTLDRGTVTPYWQSLEARLTLAEGSTMRGLMPLRFSDGATRCQVFWWHATVRPR